MSPTERQRRQEHQAGGLKLAKLICNTVLYQSPQECKNACVRLLESGSGGVLSLSPWGTRRFSAAKYFFNRSRDHVSLASQLNVNVFFNSSSLTRNLRLVLLTAITEREKKVIFVTARNQCLGHKTQTGNESHRNIPRGWFGNCTRRVVLRLLSQYSKAPRCGGKYTLLFPQPSS